MTDKDALYRSVNQALVSAVPELASAYEEETAAWGQEMGPHVIYGTLLNPYLSELLTSDDPNARGTLRRIFQFLDELAANPDEEFSSVARATVAEFLESDPDLLARARLYMGPVMSEYARERLPFRRPRRLRETEP